MSDLDRLDQRLAAVERAVVDGDCELDRVADLATLTERLDSLDDRLAEHERRIAQLEARVDAVGGFVGNIESVNADVERQANAAIATADRLAGRIDELERSIRAADEEPALVGSSETDERDESPAGDRTGRVRPPDRTDGSRTEPDRHPSDRDRAADPNAGTAVTEPTCTERSVDHTADALLDGSTDGSIADREAATDGGRGDQSATGGGIPGDPTADTDRESDQPADGESGGVLGAVRDRLS